MIAGNLILCIVLLLSICGTVVLGFLNYSRYKQNLTISAELDALMQLTLETIKNQKAQHAESVLANAATSLTDPGSLPMDQSAMVATILNVVVGKFGDIRLSLGDFIIGEDTYVSMYVDSQTQEIILSLNPNLTKEEIYSMGSYGEPDDNTFH
tara:strand:+ start:62 stop:520 length:459 start_codon:yes stop_codon:yes gene_type:complete